MTRLLAYRFWVGLMLLTTFIAQAQVSLMPK